MSKIAFIFPGQASQYVGMCKDIYENSTLAKEYFDIAENIIGYDIKKICFEGPEECLKQTKTTQPAIFIHSMILVNLISSIKPDYVAGHSLGEYSAVAASKVISFEDALKLVVLRGNLMQNAGEIAKGTMAAIVGLDPEKVKEVCENSAHIGIVKPANFNSIDQIVISGDIEAVRFAMVKAKESGAKIVKELVVSGAFHSPLMEPAKKELDLSLENVQMQDAKIPIYANVSSNPSIKIDEIRSNLSKQLISPVLWFNSINNMINDGADIFIEVGPGKVLQGLMKKINSNVKTFGIDKFSDIQEIEKKLQN